MALAPRRIQKAVIAASEDRACNLIVYGLQDSSENSEEQLAEFWAELEEKPAVKRIGNFTEARSRPLKISLASREMQFCILRKKAKLRESETFRKVYISPDLSRGELVKKLKEMKGQNPENNYRIQRGAVVEVPPAPGTQ